MNHDPVDDPTVEALLERIEHTTALVTGDGAALDATLLHSYVAAFDPPVAVAMSPSEPVASLVPAESRRFAEWLIGHLEDIVAAHGDVLFEEVAAGVAGADEALDDAERARRFLTDAAQFLATGPQLYRSRVHVARLGSYAG